jgi:hypothetical protein
MNPSKLLEPVRLEHHLFGRPSAGPNNFLWQSGRLTFSLLDRFYSQLLVEPTTPTAAQWEEFWRVCDEIDVWSWPPTLGDVHMRHGLQWITLLEVGSRRMASNGQVDGSPPGFYAKLMRFHQALQAMVGWQTIEGELQVDETLKHTLIESEKFERALDDWISKHPSKWRKSRSG